MKVTIPIFILISFTFGISECCDCPVQPESISLKINSTLNEDIQHEKIDDVDFGVPILVGSIVFLHRVFPIVTRNVTLVNECPQGYSPANEAAINVFKVSSINFMKMVDALGVKRSSYVVSSTKEFPNNSDVEDPDAYSFKSLYIKSTSAVSRTINLAMEEDLSSFVYLCSANTQITLKTEFYGYLTNIDYTLSTFSYVRQALWKIDNQTYSSKNPLVKFSDSGCKKVEIWALLVTNDSLTYYGCTKIEVNPKFGIDDPSTTITLSSTSINKLPLPSHLGIPDLNVFLSRGSAALAPKIDGGLYIFYLNVESVGIVVSLDKKFKEKKSITIGKNNVPLDIVATKVGFIIYTKSLEDNNLSMLLEYNNDGILILKKLIMNNGDLPVTANKDQLIFYDEGSKPVFGMNAMFANQGGKLAYSYGSSLCGLIFTHYNHFGYNGEIRNDHTGDSFISSGMSNSNNEYYGWGWGTSHSLSVSQIYDGRNYITASLGDLFPENLRVCFVDSLVLDTNSVDAKRGKSVKHRRFCDDFIVQPGKIPGNGHGKSCGRLGGIFKIKNKVVVVYSRKKCKIPGYYGDSTEDYNGDIGMSVFEFDSKLFKIINKQSYKFGSGENIVGIRAQRYGDKIFILLASTSKLTTEDSTNSGVLSTDIVSKALLVNLSGDIISGPFSYSDIIVPASDDLRVLADGRVAWAVINQENNQLYIYYLPSLIPELSSLRFMR